MDPMGNGWMDGQRNGQTGMKMECWLLRLGEIYLNVLKIFHQNIESG